MKKYLVLGIIILFVGASVVPTISGNVKNRGLHKEDDRLTNTNVDIDGDDRYDFDVEDSYYVDSFPDFEPTIWWVLWPDFPGRYDAFFDVEDIQDMGQTVYGLTSADFNDDDLLDFAASWATVPWTQSSITIFYNDGDGGFSQDDVYVLGESEGYYISDLDSGDFDNDGDIDLMYTYSENIGWVRVNGTVNILFNDGDNNFNNPVMVAWHGPGIPYDPENRINPKVTTDDFDDDGDLDFLVGDNSGLVEFYKNDGVGSFISGGIIDLGYYMSWGLSSADFDNDGDIDFIVTQNNGGIYLVRNDGSDNCFNHSDFVLIAVIGNLEYTFDIQDPLPWGCLQSIDYNDDGMMDFVFSGSNGVFLLMQNDTGVFDYFTIMRLPGVADEENVGWYVDELTRGGIDVGDFNGDNIVDMVIGGIQGVVRMCYNNRVLVDIIKPDRATIYKDNEIAEMWRIIPIYSFLKHGKSIAIGDLTIEAKALEPLQKVEFYLGRRLMHTDDSEPFEWNWTGFSFRRHKVKAVVYDMDGEQAGFDDAIVWKFF